MGPRALVFWEEAGQARYADRTMRSLAAAGLKPRLIGLLQPATLSEILRDQTALLAIQAGAWLAADTPFRPPRASATGKGLCALGAVRRPAGASPRASLAADWATMLQATGGDFGAADEAPAAGVRPMAVYFDARGVAELAHEREGPLSSRLRGAWKRLRVVHHAPLDIQHEDVMRVLLAVSSLQRGGAERIALDLLAGLTEAGVRARLATMGQPLRSSFPDPPNVIHLAGMEPDRSRRSSCLARLAVRLGMDLVHGHLLDVEEARALAEDGPPLIMTVHNSRPGWPGGIEELRRTDVALLIGCSQAVERELCASGAAVPVRTAWNGIRVSDYRRHPATIAEGRRWRERWGFDPADLILAAVANPRPQKRLHLLPAILAELRQRLQGSPQARLVMVGQAMPGREESTACEDLTRAEARRLGVEDHIRWTGSVSDMPGLLAAVDVCLSTSAFEGLSLAQLEALSMGCQVVSTEVGGASEVGWKNPAVHLLPADTSAAGFGELLASLAVRDATNRSVSSALDDFSLPTMVQRHCWLYGRALSRNRPSQARYGVWLVTNNLCTGGAQSSARRLLLCLSRHGVKARAAVLQEEPDHPSPGRRALLSAGVPVMACSPAPLADPTEAAASLLEAIDRDPPQAVLLWNVMPLYKVLITDGLLDTPVYDVSPGEMYFDSLAKYFARPMAGLPCRTTLEYGARLAGAIVKYSAEATLAARTLGCPVQVIPNGVDLPPLAQHREDAGDPEGGERLVLGTAVRISPQKRIEDLLEAFRLALPELPGCRLRIAGAAEEGSEDYAADLRALAGDLPVEWVGEESDIAGFHRTLDVFVMVSEPAGCPNASLEAMASGLPVVITDVGGASEQVADGNSGLLVPPRNKKALATAIVQMAKDPQARRAMGANARKRIESSFSVERMAASYLQKCLGTKTAFEVVRKPSCA